MARVYMSYVLLFRLSLILFINSVIIIKTNVLLPQTYVTLADFVYPVYVLWIYCPQKTLNYLAIQSFDF